MPVRRGVEGFDDAQQDALEAVVRAARRLNDAVVELGGDVETLRALEATLDAATATLRPHATGKPVPRYRYREFTHEGLNELLPYSPYTGHFHPHAPPVLMERVGDEVRGHVTFGDAYEGPRGCVHGGVVSGVYDQLLALVNTVLGLGGPTASLTIDYRRPTPLHRPAVFRCWTEAVDGRKVRARGTCHVDDVLVTEAHGLFIRPTA